ncbi:MAG: helix-turn-helix transcriptional regulator [Bdellovibrio sp.]
MEKDNSLKYCEGHDSLNRLSLGDYKLHIQLKRLLVEKGLSMKALSRATGVPSKTLYHWTTGQRPRNIVQVFGVARALGVSIETLVFGERSLKGEKRSCELILLRIKGEFDQDTLSLPATIIGMRDNYDPLGK